MDHSSLKVLFVEDNVAQAELFEEILGGLREPTYCIEHVTRIGAAESRLQAQRYDVILLDLHLPDSDGPAGVERVLKEAPVTPVLVITNSEDEALAVQCVRDGAQDYLLKREVEARALTGAIRYAIERVHADQALRASEQRYSLAVAGANDGLWDWDLVHDTVYYSPRWKSFLRYEEAELGESIDEWFGRIHDDDRVSFRSTLSAHLDGRTAHFEHEHRLRTKDEIDLWVLCRGLAIRDEEGQASRVAGSLTDISQRKRAEEQLIHDALHDALTTLPIVHCSWTARLGPQTIFAQRRTFVCSAVFLTSIDSRPSMTAWGMLWGTSCYVTLLAAWRSFCALVTRWRVSVVMSLPFSSTMSPCRAMPLTWPRECMSLCVRYLSFTVMKSTPLPV